MLSNGTQLFLSKKSIAETKILMLTYGQDSLVHNKVMNATKVYTKFKLFLSKTNLSKILSLAISIFDKKIMVATLALLTK